MGFRVSSREWSVVSGRCRRAKRDTNRSEDSADAERPGAVGNERSGRLRSGRPQGTHRSRWDDRRVERGGDARRGPKGSPSKSKADKIELAPALPSSTDRWPLHYRRLPIAGPCITAVYQSLATASVPGFAPPGRRIARRWRGRRTIRNRQCCRTNQAVSFWHRVCDHEESVTAIIRSGGRRGGPDSARSAWTCRGFQLHVLPSKGVLRPPGRPPAALDVPPDVGPWGRSASRLLHAPVARSDLCASLWSTHHPAVRCFDPGRVVRIRLRWRLCERCALR